MWALTCKDYSTGSRVCWRWWQTWRYSPPTHTAMWPSSRSPHLTFHLIPKSCCDKHIIIGKHECVLSPQFHHKAKLKHIRWTVLLCFSCRCYDEMLLYDENIKDNPKRTPWWHLWWGRRVISFIYMDECVNVNVITPCLHSASGRMREHIEGEAPAPVLTLWPTCMQFSLWQSKDCMSHWCVCVHVCVCVFVWRLVLFSSTQGDRNRKRNCTRVNVSTDVTKDIKPETERLQHFSIWVKNICAAQLGKAVICFR